MTSEIKNKIAALSKDELNSLLDKIKKSSLTIEKNDDNLLEGPLSLAQEKFWYFYQLQKDSLVYNIPLCVSVIGSLDVEITKNTIQMLVERHAVLRTKIFEKEGIPFQKVFENYSLPISYFDLTLSHHVSEREVLFNMGKTPFDFGSDFLFKASIIKQKENHFTLFFLFHHIVFDGWSVDIFLKDFSYIYKNLTAHTSISLPALDTNYINYARWQQDNYLTIGFKSQLEHWKTVLQGKNLKINLPYDKKIPQNITYHGKKHTLLFPSTLYSQIEKLSKRAQATPLVIFLTALTVLLYKYCHQANINIGCPTASRLDHRTTHLVGCFMNTLVMSIEINSKITLEKLLHRVKQIVFDALLNQDVPFEKIVQHLNPERQADYHPFFQVLFVLQNATDAAIKIPECNTHAYLLDLGTAKLDLSFQVMASNGAYELEIEFNTDLFSEGMISQLGNHFIQILMDLSASSHLSTPLSTYSFLSISQANLFNRFQKNTASLNAPALLHTAFQQHAKQAPLDVALVFKDCQISYQTLEERSNQLAHYLSRQGAKRDQFIGILQERSIDLIVSILAILKLGAAYVPMNQDYPLERVNYIIQDAKISLILVASLENAYLLESSGISATIINLSEIRDLLSLEITTSPPQNFAKETAAYLIYTSGSTGTPKGIINEHKGIVNYIYARQAEFPHTRTDSFILKTPHTFDVSIWEIFLPLTLGATLFILEPERHKDASYLVRFIKKYKIHVIHFVPSMLDYFLQQENVSECLSLTHIYCSGEALLVHHMKQFHQKLSARLINLYGPTEASIDVTYWESLPESERVLIGKPFKNVEIYLLDPDGQPVPPETVSELYIGGISLARGYLNLPDKAKDNFIVASFPGKKDIVLYKTGDLARYTHDGQIEVLGRNDSQIKIRGFRVEIGEINHLLHQHPEIKEATVCSYHLDEKNIHLVAYYVGGKQVAPSPETIRAYLERFLPSYMIPSFFVTLDELPKLSSGKLDKRSLPSPLLSVASAEKTLPSNHIEEKLISLWNKLLHINAVGTTENFFRLGGHSLLAIQLCALINETFNLQLPLLTILKNPTIKDLAYEITQSVNKDSSHSFNQALLPQLPEDAVGFLHKPFPLSPIQQAYWVGKNNQLSLGNIGAHFYIELATHYIDVAAYNIAVNILIQRHPMLRAIVNDDGQQLILNNVPFYNINYNDVTMLDAIEKDKVLQITREQLAHKIYDSKQFPLFDIILTKVSASMARLYVSIDLLICDAQSIYIFFQELHLLLNDPLTFLEPIKLSFREYVLAEKNMQTTPLYQRVKNFWQEQIMLLPPAPPLPLKQSPTLIQKPTFQRKASFISDKDWSTLKAISSQLSITPSTFLLVAFSEVLCRWSNKKDFTINLTLFNRMPIHPDINRIMGDFTSIILLGIHLDPSFSFAEHAKCVQHKLWECLEHRCYSGIEVLRDYALAKNTEGMLAMPIVFTSTLSQTTNYDASCITQLGEVEYTISQTPQVYLDHQIYELAGQLHFHWDFVDNLFPDDLIENMFEAYCQFITDVVSKPNILSDLHYDLLPKKQATTLSNINKTEKQYSNHLLFDDYLKNANLYQDRIAVFSDEKNLTYAELLEYTNHLALWILQLKFNAQPFVAILLPKGWHQIVAALGIVQAKGVYIPLDPDWPKERIKEIIKNTNIKVLITLKDYSIDLLIPHIYYLETTVPSGSTIKELPVSPSDLAYIIFTSGSTGKPKGVAITHEAAKNTIHDINQRFEINEQDRIFCISSLTFDLSVYDIFGLTSLGGSIVLPNPEQIKDPAHWLEQLHQKQVTIWNSVPALLELLTHYAISSNKKFPDSLRLILISGDKIPIKLPTLIRKIARQDIKIISLGGATEASIWSVIYPIENFNPLWKSIPYGKPLHNQHMYVLNKDLQFCPCWTPGDIYIGGKGLAVEYWNDPEKTKNSFIVHPETHERLYRTGDLGCYQSDGTIEFLGRIDRQLKIRGYRIEPEEIEKVLLQNKEVLSAIVIGISNERDDKILIAYVNLVPNSFATQEILKEFLSIKLPDYMIPAKIIFLEKFPMTSNGKIDIIALQSINDKNTNIVTHPSSIEDSRVSKITDIVLSTLGLNTLEPEQNLFQHGVTSVDIIRIANAIEKEFNVRIKFQSFYRNPSISGLVHSVFPNRVDTKRKNAPEIYNILYDKTAREELKRSKKWLREGLSEDYISLTRSPLSPHGSLDFQRLIPREQFSNQAVTLAQLSHFLSPLQYHQSAQRCFYPSFGNAYAMQTYLYIKHDRIENTQPGFYYYDPLHHRLLTIFKGEVLSSNNFVPFVYSPIFDNASFFIFFIMDKEIIGSLYGEEAQNLSTLEAGYLAQLLITSATISGLGLHPVGVFDFEPLQHYLGLKDSQHYVHSLLGGAIQDNTNNHQEWDFGEI
jgi:amino acid adenylation domain-containing protein